MAEDLSQYEYAAYHSLLKALALSPASWETEEILTSLRMVLHISDEVHTDCRARVNKDPEIVELRELQKRQSQSMRAGLQQQPSMPLNAGPGNLMPMHTLESASGRGGAVGAHGMPLMAQNSTQHSSAAHAPAQFGAPLANAPGPRDTLPLATASGTGKDMPGGNRGAGSRFGGAPPAARQPSRLMSVSDIPATTVPSTKNTKVGGAQKKTLTVSKTSKANTRFAQAVPAGLDIMADDLRGYVLERRSAEGVAWEQCIVVGCRKETTGQRLTVATGFGSTVERYTADVFLRKGKAGVLWRFVMPVQRRTGDWDAALGRAAAAANAGGVAASIGTAASLGVGSVAGLVGLGGSITDSMPASMVPVPGVMGGKGDGVKKRKADVARVAEVPPYTTDLRKRAIASAQATRSPAELQAMVTSIHDKRKTIVEQLANLRVQDMLANLSHKDALAKLRSDLDTVRTKQASLKNSTPTNGKTTPTASPPGPEQQAPPAATAVASDAAAPAGAGATADAVAPAAGETEAAEPPSGVVPMDTAPGATPAVEPAAAAASALPAAAGAPESNPDAPEASAVATADPVTAAAAPGDALAEAAAAVAAEVDVATSAAMDTEPSTAAAGPLAAPAAVDGAEAACDATAHATDAATPERPDTTGAAPTAETAGADRQEHNADNVAAPSEAAVLNGKGHAADVENSKKPAGAADVVEEGAAQHPMQPLTEATMHDEEMTADRGEDLAGQGLNGADTAAADGVEGADAACPTQERAGSGDGAATGAGAGKGLLRSPAAAADVDVEMDVVVAQAYAVKDITLRHEESTAPAAEQCVVDTEMTDGAPTASPLSAAAPLEQRTGDNSIDALANTQAPAEPAPALPVDPQAEQPTNAAQDAAAEQQEPVAEYKTHSPEDVAQAEEQAGSPDPSPAADSADPVECVKDTEPELPAVDATSTDPNSQHPSECTAAGGDNPPPKSDTVAGGTLGDGKAAVNTNTDAPDNGMNEHAVENPS